jgi:hypothetical protein
MGSAKRRLALAGALLLAAVIGRAEGPPDDKMAREPDAAPAADESKTAPSVTLTRKQYEELLEKIARLEGAGKAETPTTCKVSGRVAGDVAHLKAEFEFQTGSRRTRVALGCTQGYSTDARIDNHLPKLSWGPDGFSVQVDEAGDHHLVLEIDLALSARERAAERGFDLDLPAAVATTLELELPPGVKKAVVRTTGKRTTSQDEFKTEAPANEPSRLKPPALGLVERLEVSWKAPAAGPLLLQVQSSRVVVSVDQERVATHAEITVGASRGQFQEFQIAVPDKAEVHGPKDDERVERIDPRQPDGRCTVHLKQPTTDPLTLAIDVAHPRSGGPAPVGPFVVVGVAPQGGDIFVTAPADTTLDYRAQAESRYRVIPRDPSKEERDDTATTLALRYNTLPGADKGGPPFLELDVGRLSYVVMAGLSHTLRLVRGEGGAPDAWRLTTTLDAKASNSEVDHLFVALPANFALDRDAVMQGPPLAVPTEVVVSPPDQNGQVRLDLRPKRKAFKLTLEGQYTLPAAPGDAGKLTAGLPRLVGRAKADPEAVVVSERGAVVSVELPRGLEFVPPRDGPTWEVDKAEGKKATWTADRWPPAVEVGWRPYRTELIVNGEARVTLQGRQASVVHRLWLPKGQAVPEQLPLAVPAEVIGLTVAGDKEEPPQREGKDGAPTVPLAPPADQDHPLVLRYAFRLPQQAAAPVKVPLVWPRLATGGETRVCVWSDPGTRPSWGDGPWEVRRTEEVKDEDRYPSLVLLTRQPGAPLALALGEEGGADLATFRVERVLMQVTVGNDGQQTYRARFRLGQLAASAIDVTLPQPLFRPNPSDLKSVLIAGKAAAWRPVDEAGKEVPVSPTARVQVPAGLAGKPVVLEINYTLLPNRTVLHTELRPPLLRGDPGAAPVRWQVALPPSWVPLSQDALGPEYGWGRRGWLFALHPTVPAGEFERWFAEPDPVPPDAPTFPDPSVSVWRSSPEPLRLSYVPEQAWLLVCSLTLLIVGLALAFVSLPRAVFWGTLAALGVGALLAGLFWPGVLGAVLYGCQPGALVLLPVLGLQWLLHQRYRRQVVFLPGFTRLKAGSSLVRGGGRPREPSTVDAPPQSPSSQRPVPVESGGGGKKPTSDGAP